ncbi:hypothetical protein F4823DRAFT_607626 [Ustulina deusta]|nr:hypothetical protein F4823DRAFT_607626 [Ustulina deusta]
MLSGYYPVPQHWMAYPLVVTTSIVITWLILSRQRTNDLHAIYAYCLVGVLPVRLAMPPCFSAVFPSHPCQPYQAGS